MGTAKKKIPQTTSSDHKKWEAILNALKLMLRKQNSQLEDLLQQRTLLEQHIRTLHERWVSDVRFSEDEISQMRRQLALAELDKFFQVREADLKKGSKLRESRVYKRRLEHAESELNDLKAWFDILSHRCPDQEDISPSKMYESLKATSVRTRSSSKVGSKIPENEVAELKSEYEKLAVKSSSEKSALQAEITFVWNQYKQMENNYTNQLQTKSDEVDKANEKIMKLIENLEQMQSSNTDKDTKLQTLAANVTKLEADAKERDGEISRLRKELDSLRSSRSAGEPSSSSSKSRRQGRNKGSVTPEKDADRLEVTTLRARVTKLEAEANEKNQEISALSKELQLLRSKNAAATPVLRRCTGEPSSSRPSSSNGNIKGGVVSSAKLLHEQGIRRSKRKQSPDTNEIPRLFTSEFKIPKLKTQSPLVR